MAEWLGTGLQSRSHGFESRHSLVDLDSVPLLAVAKARVFSGVKAKKKCCRSKPRCKRCPLVLNKVHKAELMGISGKDLEKVFKRARKA